MKEINISFKELIDYIRDKDHEINILTFNLEETRKELSKLKEESYLISNWLYEKGIVLAIERNKVIEIPKKED